MCISFFMHYCLKNFLLIIVDLSSFCHNNVSNQSFYLVLIIFEGVSDFFTVEVLDNVITSSICNLSTFMYLQKFDALMFFLFTVFRNLFACNLFLHNFVKRLSIMIFVNFTKVLLYFRLFCFKVFQISHVASNLSLKVVI